MITRITGILRAVLDEEARVEVGGLEYQVLIAEYLRRQLQMRIGQEVSLHTIHFFDGNPMQGRVVPRLVGFASDTELDFFDLFCTVDKVGVKKALKAMVRPVREIASAILREDVKWLTTLPGVGAATGEQIVTALKRKVARFTAPAPGDGSESTPAKGDRNGKGEESSGPVTVVDGNLIEEAYQAMMALGLSPIEARGRLDRVFTPGRTFKNVQEVITEAFRQS